MITDKDKEFLFTMLTQSTPTLFLGAGFSRDANKKENIMDGTDLKDYIFKSFVVPRKNEAGFSDDDIEEIRNYDLRRMCDTVYSIYDNDEGKRMLSELLLKFYSGIKPEKNGFHLKLTKYSWRNIFTVNIDDLVEQIYLINEVPLFVQNTNKLMPQPDNTTVLYKMHGCVNKPNEGFIFAESEYDTLVSKKIDAKLNKFVQELQNNDIIFIGARMDEPDIRYYLQVYENAGCKYRTNRVIFIDPYPSVYLKTIVKKLDATLIEASAEEFLSYVEKLNYQPDEINKSLIKLNYNGIFRLKDLEKTYTNPYESKLYYGNNCSWQDISDGWAFEIEAFRIAMTKLDDLVETNESVSCLSIYGSFFAGKSCLLKSLAYSLSLKHFDVLEYRGLQLSVEVIKEYIEKSPSHDFAIIIDNAAHYYEKIEKLLIWKPINKRIVVITASRSYYHKRKRYYLVEKNYYEFELKSFIKYNDAVTIEKKLDEKSHLSFLASENYNARVSYIKRKGSIINLIIDLTYGGISKRIQNDYSKFLPMLSAEEQCFLLELAIFDLMDIEYYPRELFTERYGALINLDSDINISEMGIVDLARRDEKGISLRNTLVLNDIISNQKDGILKAIISILKTISRYVEEKKSNVWYYIFQCLLKEDMLKSKLKLNTASINHIFLSVKSEYKDKSYYWLQLGILYQRKNDFASAYTYLQQSYSIRPFSYQIQHALARNYLKEANYIKDYAKARVAFEEGEKLMKELINSKDFYKEKAKPFSISSYITEKIIFMNRFRIKPTKKELKYMISIVDSAQNNNDEYVENAFKKLFFFLKKHGELDLIKMGRGSRFLKYMVVENEPKMIDDSSTYDPVVESIS